MQINFYKSIYLDKKTGKEIEPFYLMHKTNNIAQAHENAKSYLLSYYRDKNRGANFLNQLLSNVKIVNIRLNKAIK